MVPVTMRRSCWTAGIAYRSTSVALRHDPSPLDAWLGVSSA
jgi:hypothetical protein